ncbi:hypothetical protein ACT3TC_14785, partial [Halomonas sp. AOP27-A1-41]|uniref:hypothetical protein n=1 Tax=Halomonas sp. AOP27-A1-41 TaxID=3457707 RepID=UPI004034707B
HSWIVEAYEEHPNWFVGFDTDVEGKLKPFTVKSNANKEQLRNYLKSKTEEADNLDWIPRFKAVFDVLETALEKRNKKIYE